MPHRTCHSTKDVMTDSIDEATRRFLSASATLLSAVTAQARAEDGDVYAMLAGLVRAGGMCELRAQLTGTGLARVAVEVVEPSGMRHTMAAVELQREAIQ